LLPEECSVADLPTKRVPMTKAMASRAFFIVFVYERFKTNCIVRRESKAAKCETAFIGMYYNTQQVAPSLQESSEVWLKLCIMVPPRSS
jgi:hypothetical protein